MNDESVPSKQCSPSSSNEESAVDSKAEASGKEPPIPSKAKVGAALAGLGIEEAPAPYERVGNKSKVQIVKDTVEAGGKILIGLAGLCYVLGLIVVTIHLRQFGFNPLDLPQLHYVTAGVWTVLPIVLILLLTLFAICMFVVEGEELKQKKGPDRFFSILAVILGIAIASFIVLRVLAGFVGLEFGWTNWVWIPLLGIFAVFCLVVAGAMLLNSYTDADRTLLFPMLGSLLFGIISSVFYLALFATHTYEAIPWSTGGGRPSQVRLVVVPESKPYFETAGIKFSAGQNRPDSFKTDSLKLLLATEKELILTNSDGIAISVPADSVKAVLYEK